MKKLLLSTILILAVVSMTINCGDKTEDKGPVTDNKATEVKDPEIQKGEELFAQNCASCHGEKGGGDGPAGAALNPKPRNFKSPAAEWKNGNTEEGITKTLNEGIPGGAMVAYKHLKPEDMKAIIKYVVSLTK
jgi:mono/diheme cytochrome c family protein